MGSTVPPDFKAAFPALQPDTDGITKFVQFEPEHLLKKPRKRIIHDLGDFVAWLNKWANPEDAAIYFDKGGATAYLKEEENFDSASLQLERPLLTERWLNILKSDKRWSHKDFRDFLEDRHPEIQEGESLFVKVKGLSLATTFNYESKLDDDHNYQIAFKREDGGDVTKLPKLIYVDVPLYKGLPTVYSLPIKLKLTLPNDEKQGPTFALSCPDLKEITDQGEEDANLLIKTALDGWLVVAGGR